MVVVLGVFAPIAAIVASPEASAQSFTCAGEPATIVGTRGPDVINGTPGRDVIVALGGADVIHGRAGPDLICAGLGADVVRGGVGPDVIYAGAGNDTVHGGDGHDVLLGGDGADVLQGNTGADRVVGGAGRDQVMGGIGLDVVLGGLGADRVTGGRGDDQVDGGAGLDTCSADDTMTRCERATAATRDLVEPDPPPPAPPEDEILVDRVLHISIDGLRPDHVTSSLTPTLHRLRSEGVSTMNARTDAEFTNTLPNHTSQLTGRPVEGSGGHGVDFNDDNGRSVHDAAGEYVSSVYDVVHDHGLSTAAYVGKDKFGVHERSWNASGGAADRTGEDDGRNKFDVFLQDGPDDTTEKLVEEIEGGTDLTYVFFHIRLPDGAGHGHDWGSSEYVDAVEESDALVGDLLAAVEASSAWDGRTAFVVTADHGGELGNDSHYDRELPGNFTIPFIVWAPGVAEGGDLYDLNPSARRDPGGAQLSHDGRQPVRGHEAGNVALDLLGLPPIPGSVFNADHDLALR